MTPSPFVIQWAGRLLPQLSEPRRALDVAMGRGRHVVPLARIGYRMFGVDRRFGAVREAVARARLEGLTVRAWCADLTEIPLPRGFFDLVVVTRYLQRDLCPSLREAVRPGGVVLYETFTKGQRSHGTGPTSPGHLLDAGELLTLFEGCEILFDEEVTTPEAVARVVARRK